MRLCIKGKTTNLYYVPLLLVFLSNSLFYIGIYVI